MKLQLVPMLILLILPACSTQPVRDDSPASDLMAYQTAMERTLESRLLSNGKLYCFEFAKTEGEQDECTGELEDALFLGEGDKVRALLLTEKFVKRLTLARNPCGWFGRTFNKVKCQVAP